ncbi:MAG: hypothetical protein ACPGPE_15405 [Planctomycetota bacterium]
MDRFTVFNLIFFPALASALLLAASGGWRRDGLLRSAACVIGSTCVFWGGLVGATGQYFSRWQAQVEPPEEAFADGGSLLFVLFVGWLPGLGLTGLVFLVARWISRRRTPARAEDA